MVEIWNLDFNPKVLVEEPSILDYSGQLKGTNYQLSIINL